LSLLCAFQVLECLDMSEYGNGVLKILSGHLQSECPEMRRLVLRGLVVLSKDPWMARRMCRLSRSLLELLWNAEGDVVVKTLSVFNNVLQHKAVQVSCFTALHLAEVLQPLFNNDNTHVQLLSIHLFREVMEFVVEKGKKPLKTYVCQSLFPLIFHWHDE
ncbi:MROH5 protein, partial [Sapayoa aenigma]|nr:MROH5 protein [Sapayoa aenigma]